MSAKYLNEEATRKVLLRATAGFLRTIPVQRSLDASRHVAAFEDASRFLKSAKNIAEMVFSNYFAAVQPELCDGCETCLDRCQMAAISMDDDNRAEIDRGRCIGCGLCVITCPTEALHLVAKSEDQRRTPPPDSRGQMDLIHRLRGSS